MSRAAVRDKAILSARPALSSVAVPIDGHPGPRRSRLAGKKSIQCLEREGVDIVFGLSGGAAMPIFDALVDSKVKLVLVRHEQGATHMADGYARSTGRAGVALVTSGSGRHQHGHRPADRADGLGADHRAHRADHHPDARQGRLPGGGRHRHHLPGGQAQLPGQERQRHPPGDEGGVLHRHQRSPGPGADRSPQRRDQRQVHGAVRRLGQPARLPRARDGRAAEELKRTAALSVQEQAAGPLRGPRLGHLERGQGHLPAGGEAAGAGGEHAAGQGRGAGGQAAAPGDAGHARHRLRQQGGHLLRPHHRGGRALGRPHHRQAVRVLPRGGEDPRRHRPGRVQQDRQAPRQPGGRRPPGGRGPDPAGRASATRASGSSRSRPGASSTH